MDYQTLATELAESTYTNLGSREAAALLNQATIETLRTTLPATTLWECTDLGEYAALSQPARDAYQALLTLDDIDVSAGSNSRATLLALFASDSTTRANLVAWATTPNLISRAEQLGLGIVTWRDVAIARRRLS